MNDRRIVDGMGEFFVFWVVLCGVGQRLSLVRIV